MLRTSHSIWASQGYVYLLYPELYNTHLTPRKFHVFIIAYSLTTSNRWSCWKYSTPSFCVTLWLQIAPFDSQIWWVWTLSSCHAQEAVGLTEGLSPRVSVVDFIFAAALARPCSIVVFCVLGLLHCSEGKSCFACHKLLKCAYCVIECLQHLSMLSAVLTRWEYAPIGHQGHADEIS